MLIIGFLIVVAVAVFAGVVLSDNWGGSTTSIAGFGHTLGHLTLATELLAKCASRYEKAPTDPKYKQTAGYRAGAGRA